MKEIKSTIKKEVKQKLLQKQWEESDLATTKTLRKIIPNTHPPQEHTQKLEKINKFRLNVAACAAARDRSCLGCNKFLSHDHVLLDCKHFKDTREKIKHELNKLGLELKTETILGHERSATLTPLVHKLLNQIDRKFGI